jgi:serine/threonine protein kinase
LLKLFRVYEIFETNKYVVIIMEYVCGGDLLSFIRKRSKINEQTAKYIFRQLIEALLYINSNNIVHRDIKLDNILIDINDTIKVK